MNRTKFSMVFCAVSLMASAVYAANLSATQIADKNIAARGGLAAWRAVNTLTLTGEMDAGGKKNMKLPFVFNMKRPNKSRLELRFEDRTAVQTYDGAQGWKFRPFLGRDDVDPFTPAEAKSAAAADELDGPLVDYARKGTKLELVGMDKVDGKSAYKLKLTKKTGETRNLWVDASTFLEVKIDGEPRKLDGKPHAVAVFYRDFKSEGGLILPHTLETVVDGVKESHTMTIKTATVNPQLADARFAKPQGTLATALAQ
jgi:outer membrane lipoprotein-sorting protein